MAVSSGVRWVTGSSIWHEDGARLVASFHIRCASELVVSYELNALGGPMN